MSDSLCGLSEFFSLLKNPTTILELDDGELKIRLNEKITQTELTEILIKSGYIQRSNDFDDDFYYINLYDTDRWKDGLSPFIDKIETLYLDARHALKLRDVFYVVNEKISSIDTIDTTIIKQIKIYLLWANIFKKIADHHHSLGSIQEFIYFISDEKKAKKYSIRVDAELNEVKVLFDYQGLTKIATNLLAYLSMEDAHITERRNVMRAALSILLDEVKDGDNKLVYLVSQGGRFFQKYQEQYELYTQQFSVNRLLKEIEEKNLEYSGKVNDYISSSQTKALTMPGALIAIGAIFKSSESIEYILILLGLFLIKKMIITANDIQMESFDKLKKQVQRSMRKYQKITQEAEVRSAAENSLLEISKLIIRAESRLKNISNWARWMFWGGLIYISYKESLWSVIHQYITDLIAKL